MVHAGRAFAVAMTLRTLATATVLSCVACVAHPDPEHAGTPARTPIVFTYLGVAGWQIEAGDKIVLSDPYLSRPSLDGPLVPDEQAIAAHAPPRADAVLVGHSHVDHLLDAPSMAKRTGAVLIGSASTVRVGRASGLDDKQLIGVKGGEDLELAGFSVRAIPSLHSEIPARMLFGTIEPAPTLPLTMDGYAEGGTLAYLVRLGGREILVLDTANFIERELAGLRPDIVMIAPGLRQRIHDYTCRLLHTLGDPPIVLATHFDDWTRPPAPVTGDEDLDKFAAEVRACSPRTKLIIPKHFERMTL